MTDAFSRITLSPPQYWQADWLLAQGTDCPDDPILGVLSALARLPRGLTDQPATPQSVGWLALWSKTMGMAGVAKAVADHAVPPFFTAIDRVSSEHRLNVALTANQIPAGKATHALSGYCAWCLASDYTHLARTESDSVLDRIYDPEPVNALRAQLGPKLPHYEQLFGPLPSLSVDDLVLEQTQRADIRNRSLTLLEGLLSDSRIAPISEVAIKGFERGFGYPFPRLLEEATIVDANLIRHVLDSIRNDIVRDHIHPRGSEVLHASSLLDWLVLTELCVTALPLEPRRKDMTFEANFAQSLKSDLYFLALLIPHAFAQSSKNGQTD